MSDERHGGRDNVDARPDTAIATLRKEATARSAEAQLPSPSELARRAGRSRRTDARAAAQLAEEGLIMKRAPSRTEPYIRAPDGLAGKLAAILSTRHGKREYETATATALAAELGCTDSDIHDAWRILAEYGYNPPQTAGPDIQRLVGKRVGELIRAAYPGRRLPRSRTIAARVGSSVPAAEAGVRYLKATGAISEEGIVAADPLDEERVELVSRVLLSMIAERGATARSNARSDRPAAARPTERELTEALRRVIARHSEPTRLPSGPDAAERLGISAWRVYKAYKTLVAERRLTVIGTGADGGYITGQNKPARASATARQKLRAAANALHHGRELPPLMDLLDGIAQSTMSYAAQDVAAEGLIMKRAPSRTEPYIRAPDGLAGKLAAILSTRHGKREYETATATALAAELGCTDSHIHDAWRILAEYGYNPPQTAGPDIQRLVGKRVGELIRDAFAGDRLPRRSDIAKRVDASRSAILAGIQYLHVNGAVSADGVVAARGARRPRSSRR